MKTFKDTEGREWRISINVATIKRLRESALHVDLLDVGSTEDPLLARLATDPILLVDVLYVLCQPQAEGRNITDEEFGAAMAGDVIDAAVQALLEDLVNFTPNQRDRTRLQRSLEKMQTWIGRGQDVLDKRLEDPRLEHDVDSALAKLGNGFGNPQVSSASTRDH